MEIDDSFDLLFKDWSFEDARKILPLVRKCISTIPNEREVLRALEVAHGACVKRLSLDEVEELFQITCPAAKNIVENKLKFLERDPTKCIEWINLCLKIVSDLQQIFEHLKEFQKISINCVKSFLIASCETLFNCFYHCKMSEKIYGSLFCSLSDVLSTFFKSCCNFLDHLLIFITDKVECDTKDDREISLLDEVLKYLSRSGILLISLEAKTMAKVWKAFALLIEKYSVSLKNNQIIAETIQSLCCSIITNTETVKSDRDLKLSCFLLKLVIKLLELIGCPINCQNSLLNLLLRLCKCNLFLTNQGHAYENLMNQLTTGTEPLLSQLMTDEMFVKECHEVSEDIKKTSEFNILCCLACKKLVHGDSFMRSLWFNDDENILKWILISISSIQFITSTVIHLPSIMINGKQTKFTDLYEYVFVTTSAFLMTATAEEYRLIEKILFENILQENPIKALFAIDTWCLLARFADSELCYSQIVTVGKMFQEFHPGTVRVEKWYLASLIRRLFPLLARSHRELFLKFFEPSFYSTIWEMCGISCFVSEEIIDIRQPVIDEVNQLLDQNEVKFSAFEPEPPKRQNAMYVNFGSSIVKLWKFNCEILSSSSHSVRFLKIVCSVTASVISNIPSEDLLLILTQMRKLLEIGQPTCVKLYFLWILNSLSAVSVPPGNFQKRIFSFVGELFRDLLSSKEILLKLRAFEIFYFFSHVTSHGEVIGLSVQNAPELKLEITNYFKKIVPDMTDFSFNDYIGQLHQLKFEHICPKEESERMPILPNVGLSPVVQETAKRWKTDGKKIVEYYRFLPETERYEIRTLCSSILSLPQ